MHSPRSSKINFTSHYAEGHEISDIADWSSLHSGQDVRHQAVEWNFGTDTIWSKTSSISNNVASQLYTHKCGFNWIYHLQRENGEQAGHSLSELISELGSHEHLTYDGAAVQVGTDTSFMNMVRQAEIYYHLLAPRRPNGNPEEGSIREVNQRFYQVMLKTRVPKRQWDFGLAWICEIGNVTVNSSRYANGRTPLEIIAGCTPDITKYLDFGFYN